MPHARGSPPPATTIPPTMRHNTTCGISRRLRGARDRPTTGRRPVARGGGDRVGPDGAAAVAGEDHEWSTSTTGSTSSGFHIQPETETRQQPSVFVYTYPSKKAMASITRRVRTMTPQDVASDALRPCCASSTRCCGAGPPTSGTACPRRPSTTSTTTPGIGSWPGSADDTPDEVGPPVASVLPNRRPVEDGVELFQPQTVTVSRYRYRARTSDHPGRQDQQESIVVSATWTGLVESRMRGDTHVRFGGR